MEESFKENPDPYDDNHIEMVERQVRRKISKQATKPEIVQIIILNYPRYIARKYLQRDSRIQPLNERIRSLASTFHSHISSHSNQSISYQAQVITNGRLHFPIHSSTKYRTFSNNRRRKQKHASEKQKKKSNVNVESFPSNCRETSSSKDCFHPFEPALQVPPPAGHRPMVISFFSPKDMAQTPSSRSHPMTDRRLSLFASFHS
ncbi:hypothetical protein TNIN_424851 [Trichonephila inaurata madagascariensis]|uniref:Uncharacterized protein n=1 Tax=Trichonephila inaurata madagascariensis TaxID=2747483 RepID=A0A8X6X2M0_9ARAC|nr:hypothetical protein TNIN_424851 [Trichonephila inaurata madagascariensis]